MGTLTVECEITLKLCGDLPEWARPEAQQVMEEVCEVERVRVRKAFETALADHFGAGILGNQSDA